MKSRIARCLVGAVFTASIMAFAAPAGHAGTSRQASHVRQAPAADSEICSTPTLGPGEICVWANTEGKVVAVSYCPGWLGCHDSFPSQTLFIGICYASTTVVTPCINVPRTSLTRRMLRAARAVVVQRL